MSTVRVPAYALGSPQDDTGIRFDSEKWLFFDASGNTWTPDE